MQFSAIFCNCADNFCGNLLIVAKIISAEEGRIGKVGPPFRYAPLQPAPSCAGGGCLLAFGSTLKAEEASGYKEVDCKKLSD